MTIREWLHNPSDFDTGLYLYEKYGTSGNMKRLMRIAGDTPKWRKTLIYELGKLIDKDAPMGVSPEAKKPVEINPAAAEKTNYVERALTPQPVSPNIAHLDKKWKDLYKLCNHKKASLSLTTEPSERCANVHFILDSFDKEIHPMWEQVDYYKEHGHLPPEEVIQVKSMDPVSLVTRRNNLRSYITKAEKGKKYVDPEKIPVWQKEIDAIENELENLKKKK